MREKATKSHIGEGKAGDILRRRIQRLAAGKFEQEQPVLSLSEEKIEIEVLEGQDYTGEFVIEVSNHVPVKGLIYSSNPYMECLTPEFPQGARVYSVDGVAPSLLNSASAMRSQAILVSGGAA